MTTVEQAIELGLSKDEYNQTIKYMDRIPNITELGIFSAMWSEHCSYKSSRKWLKTLPTEAPWVIQGPGENAGIIDIGNGLAAVFKMESHNHPSFIEPYQGAATGVGGIMRDVFTMGARPVANLNCLRFGSPSHHKTKHLLSGVVAGIGGYGNCMGVPTIGGECTFDKGYNGNILVNAMTVGIVKKDKIFYAKAGSPGSPVVYVGAKTGRDGIHGASMASAAFDADTESKRPTVQVGDPFTEKLLLEACLELMATDCIIGIQDMGAAGLTSSAVEMAAKDNNGIEIDLDKVPVRETKMTPFEIMLSESQERMLMVIKHGSEEEAEKIFKKWELDFSIIGKVTDTKNIVLTSNNTVVADMPLEPLANGLIYDRPYEEKINTEIVNVPNDGDCIQNLIKLIGSHDLCSRKWIWEQYDHMVMGDTIGMPGSESGVVRIHGSDNQALAITTDCTPRYCEADAKIGGMQAVAECFRNLCSVGALPLAITDCLNFGNPENSIVMGQIVSAIDGISSACKTLSMPVVAGNVSLYNETDGKSIPPTPQIGAVGLIKDTNKQLTNIIKKYDNQDILIIGETKGHLECSIYAKEVEKIENGHPPKVDLEKELSNGKFILNLANQNLIHICKDISDGGLAIALAEICIMSNVGCEVQKPDEININSWLYGEDQGRYIVISEKTNTGKIIIEAKKRNILVSSIGKITDEGFAIKHNEKKQEISIENLSNLRNNWFNNYFAK
ncbi:MAG: phosphoribosylformylglycinamidine synthase subunit PurL [Alphaproteobacteria bacterium]|jgi:phosphoribosylformylglycinamidine synthase II|tara:strand:- start:743 stop:2929 length:2187 start_codon:yes stop_codon:yes gene_type:complete